MFTYFNPNPKGKRTGDCVIRALCKALGLSWYEIYDTLSEYGREEANWGDSNAVWRKFLKDEGFRRRVIPDTCPDCYTVADFAEDHPRGIYILATGGRSIGGDHVVTVIDGDWYDSWDSGGEIPIYYWEG